MKVWKNTMNRKINVLFVFLTSDVKKNSKLKMCTILCPLYTLSIKSYMYVTSN